MRALQRLDLNSSPGYPYLRQATNNRQLFTDVDGNWLPDRVEWCWDLVSRRLGNLSSADPIRLFVKPEPHSLKKMHDKRYRLISSVSVVDQIIDHMIFGDLNDLLIKNWHVIPSKPGWSFLHGGWKMMPPKGKWVAIDKSSWDWTVQLWLLEMVLEARLRLCRTTGELRNRWFKYAYYRFEQLYLKCVFITSGGHLLRQLRPGALKSGCVNTIADNSLMQYLLHLRVVFQLGYSPGIIMSMGDDTLQQEPEDLQRYIQELQTFCIVKQYERLVEFAGFRFDGMQVEPSYRAKHSFNLLHVDDAVLPDVAVAYSLMYHRSKYRVWIRSLFEEMGLDLPSLEYFDAIFDGEV
ncbi:hypothetical protein 2 [Hubei sobemo-like virus 20]|uniref:hypothetical protein 2 n=1 Tax=Hubei sobemo-like virus 20 TaxID=1923206 RepID=UPI00090CB4C1|nr:hypothetical protein 2 [Hubei sobemo-like virus 20]APG75722.1 hypothetical protein 2 [Hubei sobemo-like virus 20]